MGRTHLRLGTAWYPERTARAAWAGDAARMRAHGLTVVRLGEFAWSALEPRRDALTWAWLDAALDVLAGASLAAVLCTPTAAPPVWLVRERPDVLGVGEDGRPRQPGSRRHTCPTSPAYREESARIAGALVARYGEHPAVVAWQLDNEPGNHDSARCWCGFCRTAFTGWLESRYGTVAALNHAWGARFWSGEYPDLGAVELPRATVAPHNPSLLLAHRRFSSAQMVAFLAAQHAIVAAGAPGRDVTVNLHLSKIDVDPHAVGALTDVASHDSYPTALAGPDETAFVHDLNAGRAGRSWVAEQQPGPVNWTALNEPVAPGQVRAWAWQAALHGVDTLLFFPWRAARSGPEQYHAALLRHDGSSTRALGEVARVAAELAAVAPRALRRPPADVVLLHSFDDVCALDITPHRAGLRHRDLVLAAYTAARRLGLEVDVRAPTADLAGYGAVLAPGLHLADAGRLAALTAALEAGALVVLGPRALVVDADVRWAEDPVPSGLAARLGAWVVEPLSQTMAVTVPAYGDAPCGPWTDVLAVQEADVLAAYGGDTWLDGAPAAVRRGNLVYAGFSSVEAWTGLLAELLHRAVGPAGTERFVRPGLEVTLDHEALSIAGLPAPSR